jgi:hypothetical protein
MNDSNRQSFFRHTRDNYVIEKSRRGRCVAKRRAAWSPWYLASAKNIMHI